MKKCTCIAIGIMACLFSTIYADKVSLDSQQDCFVSGVTPGLPTGPEVYVAVVSDWELELVPPTKGLIQFDLSLLGDVLEVQTAVLTLHITNASAPGELEFLRAGGGWDESSTTWNTRPEEDRGENAFGIVTGPGQFTAYVTNIVQDWAVGLYPNNGFYIDVPDRGEVVDIEFASKDATSAGTRPKLDITYIPGNEVSENEEITSITLNVDPESPEIINYNLPSSMTAELSVYDVSGKLVESYEAQSGSHSIALDAVPGVYFIRLQTPDMVICNKTVVLN